MQMQVASISKSDSKPMVELAMKSADFRVKSAGCILARRFGDEYLEDLIESVPDDSELVRQASRESLIVLAVLTNSNKKLGSVDFGPIPGDKTRAGACASQTMWKAWFAQNKDKLNKQKSKEQ